MSRFEPPPGWPSPVRSVLAILPTSPPSKAFLRSLAALAFVTLGATGARAQVDTLDYSNTTLGPPQVASVPIGDLIPAYGAVHATWTRGTALQHAWKLPDPWQWETVADTARSTALAVHDDGLPVVVFADDHGHLILGERDPSQWSFDTLATYPGSTFLTSLALDPEPVVAFVEIPASGPSTLRVARRSGGIWTLTDLDTGSFYWPPSLAIGPGGERGVSCGRDAATLTHQELVFYEAASPGGSFAPTVVDSQSIGPSSLAWDLARDRPLVLYGAQQGSSLCEYRFGWRENSGDWSWQSLGGTTGWQYLQLALALDSAGAPGAFWQDFQNVLPPGSNGVNSCGSVGTGTMELSVRYAAAPYLQLSTTPLSRVFALDCRTSARGAGSHYFGTYDLAWREPWSGCAPYGVFYQELTTGVSAVPPTSPPVALPLALAPDPLPAVGALHLHWWQPRSGDVRFEAHDLAGRRVANLDAGVVTAGAAERDWTLPALSPGVYWVSLRLDGERIARSVLIRR